MKKVTIALAIILSITVIGLGVLSGILFVFNQKIDSNKETIKQQESFIVKQNEQMTSLSASITEKDKKIKELNNVIAEKDKKIQKQDKQISVKKTEEKENNSVADTGKYTADDDVPEKEVPVEGGGVRVTGHSTTIVVKDCSKSRIVFDVEYWSHAHQEIHSDDVYAELNNKKGSFSFMNDGTAGEIEIKGTIEILSNKKIKITHGKNWWKEGQVQIFTKE